MTQPDPIQRHEPRDEFFCLCDEARRKIAVEEAEKREASSPARAPEEKEDRGKSLHN